MALGENGLPSREEATWGIHGFCPRCRQNPSDARGYCCVCFWKTEAEVSEGMAAFEEYLAAMGER